MNLFLKFGILCFLLLISSSSGEDDESDELKSLKEAIDVGTGKEFGNLFEGEGNSANKLRYLFHAKTNIRHEYIDEVFLEAAKVKSLDDLDDIHLDVHAAVDMVNEVIKHFQKNPRGGRKDEL